MASLSSNASNVNFLLLREGLPREGLLLGDTDRLILSFFMVILELPLPFKLAVPPFNSAFITLAEQPQATA